jgi:hypothetical protein
MSVVIQQCVFKGVYVCACVCERARVCVCVCAGWTAPSA